MPGALSGPALHEAKRMVRTRIMTLRDALDPSYRRTASAAIVHRLSTMPSFATAQCVLLTLPFASEWDTRPLLETARVDGKLIALPRVNGESRMLELHRVDNLDDDIVAGYRGIPEPATHTPRVDLKSIDWVLVPGLAFDRRGGRLGYGGGYYDRMLGQLTPGTPRIAGAYAMQIIDSVPAAPHDLAVDAIATDTELLTIRPIA